MSSSKTVEDGNAEQRAPHALVCPGPSEASRASRRKLERPSHLNAGIIIQQRWRQQTGSASMASGMDEFAVRMGRDPDIRSFTDTPSLEPAGRRIRVERWRAPGCGWERQRLNTRGASGHPSIQDWSEDSLVRGRGRGEDLDERRLDEDRGMTNEWAEAAPRLF